VLSVLRATPDHGWAVSVVEWSETFVGVFEERIWLVWFEFKRRLPRVAVFGSGLSVA
jgi:hypothetical protein